MKALPIVARSGNAFAANSTVALAELLIGTELYAADTDASLYLSTGSSIDSADATWPPMGLDIRVIW